MAELVHDQTTGEHECECGMLFEQCEICWAIVSSPEAHAKWHQGIEAR